MAHARSIEGLLARIGEAAENQEKVSVNDMFAVFGRKAYGPVVSTIGLLSLSPLGAIPGASVILGSLLIILMTQFILRDGAPWIPGRLRSIAVDSNALGAAVEKSRPYARRIERVLRPRMEVFVEAPWTYAAAGVVAVLALTFFPLALVPWGVALPSLAIALIGVAWVAHDGQAMLIAFGIAVMALAAAVWLII